MSYQYNKGGQRTYLAHGNTGVLYSYNPKGLLQSINEVQAGIINFAYDTGYRLTNVTYPNGVTSTYNYDEVNNLTAIDHAGGQVPLNDYLYEYDANGNRTKATEGGVVNIYTYDSLYRLTSVSGGQNATFGYDKAGNMVSRDGVTRSYNGFNRLTNDGTNSLYYDSNGNVTNDGANAYTWDKANRLLSMGGSSYAYDGMGNRVEQTENSNTTRYLNDIQAGLTQILTAKKRGRENIYVHGPLGVVAMKRAEGLQYGQTNWGEGDWQGWAFPLIDGLGSVRTVVDDSGSVVETHEYLPYGGLVGNAPEDIGFTGEYTDPNGLVYLRARYYNPATATFMSRDSFAGSPMMPMSLNRYAYAHGSPTNYTDPSGHIVFVPILLAMAGGAAVGALAGAAIDYGFQVGGNMLRDGFDWNDFTNVNLGSIAMSAAEGAILGAISGGFGGAVAGLSGLSKGAKLGFGALTYGVDAAIGTTWDTRVRGDSLGTALFSNVLLAGAIEGGTQGLGRAFRHVHGADVNVPRMQQQMATSNCSFSEDTMVATPDGDKCISEIRVGDAIMGSYVKDGEVEVDVFTVTATHSQHHETTLDLTISGEVIHTTDEHPFLTESGWVEAGQLNIGDEVLASDSSCGVVEAITIIHEPQTMFNLTVELVATYVVGSGQWVVHNCPNQLQLPGMPNPQKPIRDYAYSVLIEVNLRPKIDYPVYANKPKLETKLRNNHNKYGNTQLKEIVDNLQLFEPDQFAEFKSLFPEVIEHLRNGSIYQSPRLWTWHHNSFRVGILQLIPTLQHQHGPLKRLIHPNNVGGFARWANSASKYYIGDDVNLLDGY